MSQLIKSNDKNAIELSLSSSDSEEAGVIQNKSIDWQYLDKLLQNDRKQALEMIAVLIEDLSGMQEKIEQAYVAGDVQALSQIVHTLCGSSTYCGAVQLKKAATMLEYSLSQQAEISKSRVLYYNLMAAIEAFRNAYYLEVGNNR